MSEAFVVNVGARREGDSIVYPVNEVAAKYGASVTVETNDPAEAYADWPDVNEPVELDWPLG